MMTNQHARIFLLTFLLLGLTAAAQDSPLVNVTGGGTANFIPRWTAAHALGNSTLFQTGGNIGIGTTSPASKLDVNGAFSIHGSGFSIANSGLVNFVSGQTFPNVALVNVSNIFGPDQFFDGNIILGGTVFPSGDVNATGNVFAGQEVVSGAELFAPNAQVDCSNCFAFLGFNNGGQQVVQTRNFAGPANNVFEIASFDANNKAVFYVDSLGDFTATGTKSAAVPLKNGTQVKLFAMESPQNWFEDFGSASLVGGVATVTIDTKFAQTVNAKQDYKVFLTPNGDCHGLYVTQKTPTSFEVRELGAGQSNVAFDYRIIALRSGYEAVRLPVAKPPVAAAPTQPQHAALRPLSKTR